MELQDRPAEQNTEQDEADHPPARCAADREHAEDDEHEDHDRAEIRLHHDQRHRHGSQPQHQQHVPVTGVEADPGVPVVVLLPEDHRHPDDEGDLGEL